MNHQYRPRIAIIGRFAETTSALRYRGVVNARALLEAVWDAGGDPFTLLPVTGVHWGERLGGFDGMLLPGGGDIDPARYDKTWSVNDDIIALYRRLFTEILAGVTAGRLAHGGVVDRQAAGRAFATGTGGGQGRYDMMPLTRVGTVESLPPPTPKLSDLVDGHDQPKHPQRARPGDSARRGRRRRGAPAGHRAGSVPGWSLLLR